MECPEKSRGIFKRLEASAYNTDPDFAEKALKVHAMICEVLGYGG